MLKLFLLLFATLLTFSSAKAQGDTDTAFNMRVARFSECVLKKYKADSVVCTNNGLINRWGTDYIEYFIYVKKNTWIDAKIDKWIYHKMEDIATEFCQSVLVSKDTSGMTALIQVKMREGDKMINMQTYSQTDIVAGAYKKSKLNIFLKKFKNF